MITTEQLSGPENQLLRSLMDNLPDNIFIKDRQSRFVISNLACARALGALNPGELAGKTDRDFFPAEMANQLYADEQALMRSGTPLNREELVANPRTGEARWLQTRKAPLRDQDGNIIGLVGVSRDITEQKQAGKAPIGADGQLQAMLDSLSERIYLKDAQSRFIQCNQAFAQSLGVENPQRVVGKTEADFLPAEKARQLQEDDRNICQSGQPILNKLERYAPPTGDVVWTSITKLPVRNPAGGPMGMIGILRDVSDLKRTEKELERTHRRLLETSRMAGMAEVATGVLHNVGNVLNSINVSAALITERLRESKSSGVAKVVKLLREHSADIGRFLTEDERGSQVLAYLEQLAEHLEREQLAMREELKSLVLNVGHIKEIVTTQQNYARISGVIETVTVPDLVEDALKIHGGAYVRHGVTVVREFATVPTISVDKHKVLQILVNLFHNAKYACDAGGKNEKQVTVRIKTAGEGRVKIEVADTGVGIAPENQGRIFSQGYTTRKGGHGFGLHSGALAAQQLGGALTVHSDGPNLGATFTLELPLLPPPQEKSDDPSADKPT